MPAETGTFRTDNLGLAVCLSCKGFKYEVTKFTQETVLWVFTYSHEQEEEFDTLVGEYEDFTAAVEPRQFMGRWAEMRREFFAIIPRRPRESRPAVPVSNAQ